MKATDPILSCKEAAIFERDLFKNSSAELDAMSRAGGGIARLILREFGSRLGENPSILVLAGGGHNGGDALCAARILLKKIPSAELKIFFASSSDAMKPNTEYFANLIMREPGAVRMIGESEILKGADLIIEGLLGMSFKPPMREKMANIIRLANKSECGIKASVDLPAGLGDENSDTIFRADVTYMTGIAKAPVFEEKNAAFVGRLRYVDLNFFENKTPEVPLEIVSDRIFEKLKALRRAQSDKRTYGYLLVFAGSAKYSGAALMNVKAALRCGVGLVSAFVPESAASSLAAAEPACIWIPCPETENGSLSLETFSIYKAEKGRGTAILAGSGLGESAETSALIGEIAKTADLPLVFDADAVRQPILDAALGKKILITPHAGEFLRLASGVSNSDLLELCASKKITCILKGHVSRICDGEKIANLCAGGPMLSRAGSGDVLAGLAGALAARGDLGLSLFESACAASLWAGRAAECAFAVQGENAYATSDIFKYLHKALEK